MRWESIFPNLCKSYNLMRNVDLKKWKMYLLPASDAEAEEIWCRTPGKFLWWRWRFNLSFQGTRSQSRAERLDQVPALATHHQDLIFFLKTQTRQKNLHVFWILLSFCLNKLSCIQLEPCLIFAYVHSGKQWTINLVSWSMEPFLGNSELFVLHVFCSLSFVLFEFKPLYIFKGFFGNIF